MINADTTSYNININFAKNHFCIVSKGTLWSDSYYGSWIYKCLCNQCLSPLKL